MDLRKLQPNIYPPAWDAVSRIDSFPWHRYAHLPHSSQALSVDVFGTLMGLEQAHRDAILSALALSLGIPPNGPWSVELEWLDPRNRLKEKRRTQVDVLLKGRKSIICVECKFTETAGGTCSQTQPRTQGRYQGKAQCNGIYEPQTNPINEISAKCALSGKGIRYWDVVSEVMKYSGANEYRPCPFCGSTFQWMRNMVLSGAVAKDEGRRAAFVLMYADAPVFKIPRYLAGRDWGDFTRTIRNEAVSVSALSYQSFIETADKASGKAGFSDSEWSGLGRWATTKVEKCG